MEILWLKFGAFALCFMNLVNTRHSHMRRIRARSGGIGWFGHVKWVDSFCWIFISLSARSISKRVSSVLFSRAEGACLHQNLTISVRTQSESHGLTSLGLRRITQIIPSRLHLFFLQPRQDLSRTQHFKKKLLGFINFIRRTDWLRTVITSPLPSSTIKNNLLSDLSTLSPTVLAPLS